jgi:hypothetical protein
LIFPKLALGLSGFETGVSVMPQIDDPAGKARTGAFPVARVASTKKLLTTSAVLMSVMLVLSSFVTTILIPPEAFAAGGPANGRAIAWLAHQLLGDGFGALYDLVTIAILWFAGASALAGLLNLIPRYLPRFGMAPRWVEKPRPLVALFFLINVLVTIVFHADVDAQGGAYATGVLAVMLSAAVAVTLSLWKTDRNRGIYFGGVSLIFLYVMIGNVLERPDGVVISSIFIAAMLIFSAISRFFRSHELRVEKLAFVDEESLRLWGTLKDKKVHLVPLHHGGEYDRKAAQIRSLYKVEGPIAFLHVDFIDDRSEFESALRTRVTPLGNGDVEISIANAVAVANTVAFISEELDPISLFLTLTRQAPTGQALRYLLWGEGEVGTSVYDILTRYWRMTPEEDVRPRIFLLSE